MLGEGGRRRKVEERGGCDDGRQLGNSDGRCAGRNAGERDGRGGTAELLNRNPNDVSYGLLPNLWLSQLLEKHNQVLVKSNHPLDHSF